MLLGGGPHALSVIRSHLFKTADEWDLKAIGVMDREAEASAHLTGIMTASELFLMFLVQKLGLTLSRLEDVEASSSARQAQLGDAGNQDVAGVSEASQIPLPDQNLKSE